MGLLGTEIKPRSPSLVVIGICLCWLLRGFKGTTNLYTLVVCYVMYYDLSAAFVPSYVGGIFDLVQTTCFLQSFNSIFKGHLKGLGGHYIQKPGEDSNLRLLSDKLSKSKLEYASCVGNNDCPDNFNSFFSGIPPCVLSIAFGNGMTYDTWKLAQKWMHESQFFNLVKFLTKTKNFKKPLNLFWIIPMVPGDVSKGSCGIPAKQLKLSWDLIIARAWHSRLTQRQSNDNECVQKIVLKLFWVTFLQHIRKHSRILTWIVLKKEEKRLV